MMKKQYIAAEAEVVLVANLDVITTSGPFEGEDEDLSGSGKFADPNGN